MPTTADLAAFERELLAEIPLARAMELRVRGYADDELVIAAPLPPNVNDKGCAFGGSLVSLLTLAGWGVVTLKLADLGRNCDVYVQDSHVRYVAPVWADFTARARLADGESWPAFADALAAKGRARIRVHCRVPLADGGDACTLEARFVAIARAS
ncbi:MAG TPA: YiiD C-terminal domain-containing protein [Rudaea sp.]|nr:YiiD C-terminal domain-containing protein [Rudaea sp.]